MEICSERAFAMLREYRSAFADDGAKILAMKACIAEVVEDEIARNCPALVVRQELWDLRRKAAKITDHGLVDAILRRVAAKEMDRATSELFVRVDLDNERPAKAAEAMGLDDADYSRLIDEARVIACHHLRIFLPATISTTAVKFMSGITESLHSDVEMPDLGDALDMSKRQAIRLILEAPESLVSAVNAFLLQSAHRSPKALFRPLPAPESWESYPEAPDQSDEPPRSTHPQT